MEPLLVILVCATKCDERPFRSCQILLKDLRARHRQCLKKYLSHAKGSAGELRAQLYIARDQGYIADEEFTTIFTLAETCSKQLARFIQYLESQPNARRVREEGVTYNVE
jgi:hypothetical protein